MKKIKNIVISILLLSLILSVAACNSEVKYKIKFESNGGTPIGSIVIKKGESIKEPEPPTKAGDDFMGWFENSDLSGDKVIFPYTPLKNITLYAKWKEQSDKESYITISSIAEFQNISLDLSKNYKLTKNIDFGGIEWTPIGDAENPFSGVFSGGGYVISNFIIKENYVDIGLFGCNIGTIKNLGIENFTIEVNDFGAITAGGLIGNNDGGIISGCYAVGSINIVSYDNYKLNFNTYAGGLIGINNNGTVSDSHANVSIYTTSDYLSYAGGLIAGNYGGNINNCYAKGNINTISDSPRLVYTYSGGLVGQNDAGEIENSYATGNINVNFLNSSYLFIYAGGLVGENISGSIQSNYACGNIDALSSESISAGGLIGADGHGTINNNYAVGNVNATSNNNLNNGFGVQCYTHVFAGGLIGYIYYSTIKNCYAVGTVRAVSVILYNTIDEAFAGGLIGQSGENAVVENSFAVGDVSSTGVNSAKAGGIVGIGNGSVINSYRYKNQLFYCKQDLNESNQASNIEGLECDLNQLNSESFYKSGFLNWDSLIWNYTNLDFNAGNYPKIK